MAVSTYARAEESERLPMGVFDGVFATRGKPEAQENSNGAGVFDELFVRRGRWRKPTTTSSDQFECDVVQLAHQLNIMDPILENSDKNATNTLLGGGRDPSVASEITDTSQFVVKNTFLNMEIRDSLQEFLSERQVQSCPAGSINIDDVVGVDDADADARWASDDVILSTASTWQKLRTMSFDDASYMHEALRTMSFDDASRMDDLLKSLVFNTASTFGHAEPAGLQSMISEVTTIDQFANDSAMCQNVAYNTTSNIGCTIDQTVFEQWPPVENRLNTLRMSGSQIHQSITETSPMPMSPPMQFVQMASCAAPPSNGLQTVNVSMLPVPPPPRSPPPPLETVPVAPPVLRLADALQLPVVAGPLAPSLGSLLHHSGECRPCTFFHTRGCQNADMCEFCHLCGPGEKKKRLRAEKSFKRQSQIAAVQNARAVLANLDAAERNAEVEFIVE